MNSETHEDRVKILAGAPDGATHHDSRNGLDYYYRFDNSGIRPRFYCWHKRCEDWDCIEFIAQNVNSLADIQKLVDMQYEIDELKGSIKSIITTYRDSSGYEPSLSVFHRELSEAEELLDE